MSIFECGRPGLLDAIQSAGSEVLSREGERRDVQADRGQEDDLLDSGGDPIGGDALGRESIGEPGDDENAQCDRHHIQAGRETLAHDRTEGASIRPKISSTYLAPELGSAHLAGGIYCTSGSD